MPTHFNTLLKTIPSWFTREGETSDIVVASMGRLVRNLPALPFPGWSSEESRKAVADALLPVLQKRPGFKSAFHADVSGLSLEQRRLLQERRLITPCMAARNEGCHVLIPRRQDVSIMLNEEEHLVIHFCKQGYDLGNVLIDMQHFAAALEQDISFAHDAEHGYLTSLPAEAGEGMQLSVVLHLPALSITDVSDQIARALEKLHLNMTPFYTGMQGDTGSTYILFTNAIPLGGASEAQHRLEDVVNHFIRREIQVRAKLISDELLAFSDRIGRSLGLLTHAVKLGYEELLNSISMLRIGHQCGMVTWNAEADAIISKLVALSLELAPEHLSQSEGGKVPSDLCAALRASHVKEILAKAEPNFTAPSIETQA